MLHTTLIIISMIAMTLAAPMTPSNVTAMAATNGNAQGVVLCSGVGGQGGKSTQSLTHIKEGTY